MNSDDRRALIEQAHQLSELTRHPGWAVLVDWAHHIMVGPKKKLLNDNGVDDIATYKSISGWLIGVHRVIGAPDEVQKAADTARAIEAEARDQEPHGE